MSSVHDGKEREEERERKQALSLGHTDKSQHSPRHTYKLGRKCEFLSLSGQTTARKIVAKCRNCPSAPLSLCL